MKKVLVCGIIVSALAFAGCYSSPETTSTPTPTVVPTVTATVLPTPSATVVPLVAATPPVKSQSTRKAADGSTIVTYLHTDGSKTEVRTMPTKASAGPRDVATVTRTTSPSGDMTASVTYHDNTKAEVSDKNWVDKSMSATGDALKTAGEKTADASKSAASATAAGAKTVGKETAKGAAAVGEKTAEGAKTVGSATAKGAEAAGKATVEGAKKVGNVLTGKKSTPKPKQ